MSITVLEAMKLDILKNFKLIAGHRGLENKIEKVGILDYEFDKKAEGHLGKGQFEKNQFVITSLLFAKDHPSLVLEAVKYLLEDQVSGLAVKNIYYNDLPAEVIDFANQSAFPVFIFDRNSAYFEDIITDISDHIRFVDNYELLEAKVDVLLKKNISRSMIRELALEINSSFKEHFVVIYCREKKYIDDKRNIAFLEKLKHNRNISLYTSVFKYRGGIFIIATQDQLEAAGMKNMVVDLLNTLNINRSDYYVGISDLHFSLDEMDQGIHQSVFALKACEASEVNLKYFSEIGIYKIVMPFLNEAWIQSFYDGIILPIKRHDEKYHTDLFSTALKYIENDGRIKGTAEALYLHENTIRYRIGKIKELLGMEALEGSFYEQMSVAIKIYKIFQKNYS